MDVHSALREIEEAVNLFLGLDTQSPDASIQEPMQPTSRDSRQMDRNHDGTRRQDTGRSLPYGNALVVEVSGKMQIDSEALLVQSFLVPPGLTSCVRRTSQCLNLRTSLLDTQGQLVTACLVFFPQSGRNHEAFAEQKVWFL